MSGVSDQSTFVAAHGDRLRVVPRRGGLVTGWLCHGPWGEREILYFDADRFADPSKSVRGGIPVLFPICGGLQGSALRSTVLRATSPGRCPNCRTDPASA